MQWLENEVAIVTGAGSGMGRATAFVFADEGAKLALVDRNAEGVEAVAAEIRAAGANATAYVADLADGAAIPALVERIGKRPGTLGPVHDDHGDELQVCNTFNFDGHLLTQSNQRIARSGTANDATFFHDSAYGFA